MAGKHLRPVSLPGESGECDKRAAESPQLTTTQRIALLNSSPSPLRAGACRSPTVRRRNSAFTMEDLENMLPDFERAKSSPLAKRADKGTGKGVRLRRRSSAFVSTDIGEKDENQDR